MSLFNSFDRNKHLSELASPLATAEGVLTPQQRRARMLAAIGAILSSASTGLGASKRAVPAPATATDTATITATQMANGLMVCTPTAAATYTLPTGTTFESQLAALGIVFGVDEGFDFTVINVATGATFDITLATAAGWTLVGNLIVDANEATQVRPASQSFRVRKTATNAYTLYNIG